MKKIFYLFVALCFIQVGIAKAQTATTTDKQEVVKTETTADVKPMSTGNCETKKSTASKSSCSSTASAPACCQKKSNTASCSGTTGTASTTKTSTSKSNLKKQEVEKEVSVKQTPGAVSPK